MENKTRYIFLIFFTLLMSNLAFSVAFADDFGGTTSLTAPPTPPPDCQNPPCVNPPCNASCCPKGSNNPGGPVGPGGTCGPGTNGPGDFSNTICSSSGGQQINFYNGEEHTNSVDLMIGSLFPIVLERSYSNNSALDTALGYGWDHRYNQRLYIYSDGSVIIRTNSGTKTRFVYTGNEYVSEVNSGISLVQQGDGTFIFSPTPGWQHHFDRSGRLILLRDPSGNSLRLSWSEQRLPLKGRSPNGVNPHLDMIVAYSYQLLRIDELSSNGEATGTYITFSYDPDSGRMTNVTDSSDRVLQYHHDEYGNLIRIDLPEELFLEYKYTDPYDPNNLTAISRGYGNNSAVPIVDRSYDSYDRVVQENYAGGTLNIIYDASLQKTTVTNVTRNSVTGEELNTLNTVYEFYPGGYLHKITDDEKQMEYQRDDWNNVIEEILYTNQGTYNTPNLSHYKTVSYRYNDENNLIQQQILLDSGEVVTEEYTYDNNWLTSYQRTSTKFPDMVHKSIYELNYDNGVPINLAEVKRLVSKNGDHEEYISVNFHYDDNGNLSSIVYPNGDTVIQQSTNGYPTQTEDFQYTWDNSGNLTSIREADGTLTRFEYDLAGRRTKIIDALNQETVFTYTGWDLTSVESGIVNDSSGRITLFTHDDIGRITSSAIDHDGAPVMTETYTYDSEGNILSVTDQLGRKIDYGYNNQNRVVLITEPGDYTTSITYDIHGHRTSVTDAAKHVTSYSYDSLGRLLFTTNATGGQTSYEYDALSNLIELTDGEGRKFLFGYDLAGRRIWKETPAGGRETYVLDGRDRLIEATGTDGISTGFQYDSENRLSKVILAKDTPGSTTIQYGYDSNGNVVWYVDTAISQDPVYRMQYDVLGRLVNKTLVPIDKSVSYQYTPQSELSELTVFSSNSELFSYHYQYDNAGRNTLITEYPQNTQTTMVYDGTGMLTNITFGNGITGQIEYNERGLLNDLHYRRSDITTLAHKQYSYNPLKLISNITDTQGTSTFTYDQLQRLISAAYPLSSSLPPENYSYNKAGDRFDQNSLEGEEYDQQGRLLSYDSTMFTYDLRGNLVEKNRSSFTTTYTYDALNRLRALQTDNESTLYDYGIYNQRVRKNVNGTINWFLYEGSNLLAIFDSEGEVSDHYSFSPDSTNLVGITKNDQYHSILIDHIRRPIYVTDSNQNIVWDAAFTAYGKKHETVDPDNNGALFSIPHVFPGQLSDNEADLIYNWNRYYIAEAGRYITPDPIGLLSGSNPYLYSAGNPMGNIDPMGLACEPFMPKQYESRPKEISCVLTELAKIEHNIGYKNMIVRHGVFPGSEDDLFLIENGKGEKFHWQIVDPCTGEKTDLRWLTLGYLSGFYHSPLNAMKIHGGKFYNWLYHSNNPENVEVNTRSLDEGIFLMMNGKNLTDYLNSRNKCSNLPSVNFKNGIDYEALPWY